MTWSKTPGNEVVTPRKDVYWKLADGVKRPWVVVTATPPSKMGLEPMAVYYPRQGRAYFQYRLARRPKGDAVRLPT